MSKIAIVSDSTHYIPTELIKKYNIHVVPLTLNWGETSYLDGVDMLPKQFYERIGKHTTLPTTSQPPIGDMVKVLKPLVNDGYQVFSIFISKLLSGTFNSALQARDLLGAGKENVVIFDSGTISMGIGFQILAAAQAIVDGKSFPEVVLAAEKAKLNSGIFFVCDTLDYLARGGRLSHEEAEKGNALKIKPILTIEDGKITTAERVKTKSKAIERAAELVMAAVNGKEKVRVAAFHANAFSEAQAALKLLTVPLNINEELIAEVSPVIGTHTGPGTVGLAYEFE